MEQTELELLRSLERAVRMGPTPCATVCDRLETLAVHRALEEARRCGKCNGQQIVGHVECSVCKGKGKISLEDRELFRAIQVEKGVDVLGG